MNPDDECPLSKLKLDDKTHWRSAVHPVVVWLVSTKTSRPQALTEFQFFLLQEEKILSTGISLVQGYIKQIDDTIGR